MKDYAEGCIAAVLAFAYRNVVMIDIQDGWLMGLFKDLHTVLMGLAILILTPTAKRIGEWVKQQIFKRNKKTGT